MTVYLQAVKTKAGATKRWVYDFRLSGRRFQSVCIDPDDGHRAASKRDAAAIEEKIKVLERKRIQGLEAARVRPGTFALTQAMTLYLESLVDASKLFRSNSANYAGEILRFFGLDKDVVEITPMEAQRYRTFCTQQTVKVWIGGPHKGRDRGDPRWWKDTGRIRGPETVNHYLDCFRGALLAAHRARDPVTAKSYLPEPPAIEPVHVPDRLPAPMPDEELAQRQAVAPQWTRETAELARLFGLRRTEALAATIADIRTEFRPRRPGGNPEPYRFLVFRGEDNKGGHDVVVHGGWAGADFLELLAGQARKRKARHLITWPGHYLARIDEDTVWRPLKSIRRSWRTTAVKAAIEHPHRMHDVRGRYITEIAKGGKDRLTQGAARHKDFKTTQRYIAAAEMDIAGAVELASGRRYVAPPVPETQHERRAATGGNNAETKSLLEVPTKKRSRPRRVG